MIFIAITDFVLFPRKKNYISYHKMRDTETDEHDLNDLYFVFLELPKFKKENIDDKSIDKWCDFFKNANDRHTCDTDDLIFKKAYDILEFYNWSEEDL